MEMEGEGRFREDSKEPRAHTGYIVLEYGRFVGVCTCKRYRTAPSRTEGIASRTLTSHIKAQGYHEGLEVLKEKLLAFADAADGSALVRGVELNWTKAIRKLVDEA